MGYVANIQGLPVYGLGQVEELLEPQLYKSSVLHVIQALHLSMDSRKEDVAYLVKQSIPQIVNMLIGDLLAKKPGNPVRFLQEALERMAMTENMKFGGGSGPGANLDCCTTNPNNYKVIAKTAGGRLVEMTLPAGQGDVAHDHPTHYLYVVNGGRLKLSPPPGHTEGSAEVDMPAGAALVIPAGPHQVTNVGTTDVKILFVEPTGSAETCELPDFVSPFTVFPDCYKILAEDDDWFIAKMTLKAGVTDPPHSHHDHLVYVMEGDGLTIYPGKEIGDEKKEIPIKAGMALPVAAGHHCVKNHGTKDCEIVFFEQKPKVTMKFGGGSGPGANLDCCTTNPNNYKVIAKTAGGRLVEMTLPAGQGDVAHDHPTHYLYVVNGGRLKLSPPPGHTEGSAEVDMPAGAALVIPAGPHQVTNVGTTDVKILFVEPTGSAETCELPDFVSPFTVFPDCYKILAEDDDWFIAKMTLKAGVTDPPHSHHDHLVYVMEGDGLTIYPGKEIGDEKKEIPIKAGMALPVAAGHHCVKNHGTKDCEIVFFEQKPKVTMKFGGGSGPGANLDCCTTNPNNYKVIAKTAGGRLVEMTLPAGQGDVAHDHPTHYLYVVNGGRLKLSPPPGHTEGSAEVDMPAGAALVIPAGPHQVTNVGTTDVKILFVEPTGSAETCELPDFVSPFTVFPDCYKILAEDDDWFIAKMTLKAGVTDPPHSHHDHLVYVMEGDGLTIYPGKEIGDEKKEIPIKAGMALPVAAGHHCVKNHGTKDCEIVFFEQKPKVTMKFGGGSGPGANLDCCTTNPNNYKVIAKTAGGRLVEMTLPAGQGDVAHDHPTHYLYVVNGGRLKLSPPPGHTEGSAEVDMPAGAALVIPAGPHQVTNVGTTDVKILFVEPTGSAETCELPDFVSPFTVFPDCYKILAEDDDWFIAKMTLKAGVTDPPHSHHDHLVYVMEGDGLTIYPGKEIGDEKKEIPIKAGMALPVAAGHHCVKNHGTKDCEIVFFEQKPRR